MVPAACPPPSITLLQRRGRTDRQRTFYQIIPNGRLNMWHWSQVLTVSYRSWSLFVVHYYTRLNITLKVMINQFCSITIKAPIYPRKCVENDG